MTDQQKKKAVDENGRRRFHGAFTGGWSAGYFNTVGSKEGFQPQTFRSSKADRAKIAQRPEDFMDDEDFDQAGQLLSTTKSFTPTEINKSLTENSLTSQKQTIGFKLLQIMGWKPGELIGQKSLVKKRSRPLDSQPQEPEPKKKRVLGPALDDLVAEPQKNEPEISQITGDIISHVYGSIMRKPEDFRGLGVSVRDQSLMGKLDFPIFFFIIVN